MTWSTVQHPETLTPSSILIFQGALVGTSFRNFYMVPERLFQKSSETLICPSFATSSSSTWVPMGSQGMDPWGSWVPMGSQGMDPWGSWVPMGSQGGSLWGPTVWNPGDPGSRWGPRVWILGDPGSRWGPRVWIPGEPGSR